MWFYKQNIFNLIRLLFLTGYVTYLLSQLNLPLQARGEFSCCTPPPPPPPPPPPNQGFEKKLYKDNVQYGQYSLQDNCI